MTPVTDPALLAMLNSPTPQGLKPVTDPALLAQLNAPEPQPPSGDGIFDRIGQDIDTRSTKAADAIMASQSGQQSAPEGAFQAIGQGAGLVSDALGEVGTSAFRALPDFIEQPIRKGASSALSALANTRPGQFVVDKSKQAAQELQRLELENPRAARNIGAVGNFANAAYAFPAAFGAAKVLSPLADLAAAPVKGVGKGLATIGTGIRARGPEELKSALAAINQEKKAAYGEMKQAGAVFRPQTAQKVVLDIDKVLAADGPLNQGLHGKTMSVLSDLRDAVGSQSEFTLENLDQWRRLLGRVASNVMPDNLEDARKASIVIDAIDDATDALTKADLLHGDETAVAALNRGRAAAAKGKRFETASDVVIKADGDQYKIKSGLKRLSETRKKTLGYSPLEKFALEKAGKSTAGEMALKGLGRFGIEPGNVYLPAVAGILGGVTSSGPLATGVIAAGTAARQANKYLARGKAEKFLRALESRP